MEKVRGLTRVRLVFIFAAVFMSVVFGFDTHPVYAATVIVNSNITTNTVWTEGNVYVLTNDITVLEGVELVLQPGAIVKPRYNTRLIINGVLKAQGTASNHVVFTSYKDDSYGGDTNGDGNASSPAPNDWGWIEFAASSVDAENILEYCTIRYGGYRSAVGYRGTVRLVNASPTISSCTISDAGNYAVLITPNSFPIVSNNIFVNNGTNGIGVYGGTMTINGTWSSSNYPYVIDADVTVGEGAAL